MSLCAKYFMLSFGSVSSIAISGQAGIHVRFIVGSGLFILTGENIVEGIGYTMLADSGFVNLTGQGANVFVLIKNCTNTLGLLNEYLNFQGFCRCRGELLFFTPALCYKALMSRPVVRPSELEIFVYNRFRPDFGWRLVARGPFMQLAATLMNDGPYLSHVEIPIFWPKIP